MWIEDTREPVKLIHLFILTHPLNNQNELHKTQVRYVLVIKKKKKKISHTK